MSEHYHVVEFINGCLNDYDSGPIEDMASAISDLHDFARSHNDAARWESENGYAADQYVATDTDRYQRGLYTLKVESCTEDCDPDADY